ncbi:peptidylprolyl isomerase [Geobacter sp. DSM 9736]|uniref:peptidylprolyl isomerase n=1 Tax=Geobacter sp. DSM 9736 TaxID=1277350 RepID=UPI003519A0BE
MSQEVRSKIQVGEREMMDYYKANQTRFGGEDLFHARQIFFGLGKDPSPQKTKETMAAALNVLNEARSGKDFAELAKKHSTDPRAATDGGDLGTFKRGEMLPEVDEALAGMRPGDISDVIISPAGLHIIKLETRSSAPVKPFEQVKGEIEELLYKKKSDERFNQWLEDLRKNAAIEIRNDEK